MVNLKKVERRLSTFRGIRKFKRINKNKQLIYRRLYKKLNPEFMASKGIREYSDE